MDRYTIISLVPGDGLGTRLHYNMDHTFVAHRHKINQCVELAIGQSIEGSLQKGAFILSLASVFLTSFPGPHPAFGHMGEPGNEARFSLPYIQSSTHRSMIKLGPIIKDLSHSISLSVLKPKAHIQDWLYHNCTIPHVILA